MYLINLCGTQHSFLSENKANVSYFWSLFVGTFLEGLEFLKLICGRMGADFNFCVTSEESSVCHIRNGAPPDLEIYGFD